MTKKKETLLDGILDVLGESGGQILTELLGGEAESAKSESFGENLLEGLGDLAADLTGIGAANAGASPVAKQTEKTKSSSTKKKTVKSASAKSSAKPTAKKATPKAAPAAGTAKKKSSSAKKKTV